MVSVSVLSVYFRGGTTFGVDLLTDLIYTMHEVDLETEGNFSPVFFFSKALFSGFLSIYSGLAHSCGLNANIDVLLLKWLVWHTAYILLQLLKVGLHVQMFIVVYVLYYALSCQGSNETTSHVLFGITFNL